MVTVFRRHANGCGMSLSIGRLKMKNKGSSSWARLFRTERPNITSVHCKADTQTRVNKHSE